MKLSSNQTDVESLTRLGEDAAALVAKRDFSTLAERFGYALSYGRNPVQTIESDFAQCIAEAKSPSRTVGCAERSEAHRSRLMRLLTFGTSYAFPQNALIS
jgi:hypothetical protein